MHLEVDQKYYLWQEEEDGLVHPVLDALDNYKRCIESERMNVLTIYLPCRKLPVASNLRKVKTAVCTYAYAYIHYMYVCMHTCMSCVHVHMLPHTCTVHTYIHDIHVCMHTCTTAVFTIGLAVAHK